MKIDKKKYPEIDEKILLKLLLSNETCNSCKRREEIKRKVLEVEP